MTDLGIVRRSLMGRAFGSVVTALTVAVAVALVLVLLSMRDAGQRSMQRGAGNMHLLVSADTSPLTSVLNAIFYARAPARAFPVTRASELADTPLVQWAIPVQKGDNYKGYPTLATDPEQFFRLFEPVPGQPFELDQGTLSSGDFDVVLGAQAARGTGLRVGDTLTLTHGTADQPGKEHPEFPFKVVGVLAPTQTAHDRAVIITLRATWVVHAHDFRESRGDPEKATVANLRPGERLITGIFVRARGRGDGDTPATLPQLFSQLRSDPSITVASPSQQIDQLFKIVGNIDKLLLAMALVVLVASAVTIMLVMHSAMQLRRRQTAVLRVLGASPGRVFSLALTEAAIIGLIGAGLGLLLAWLGAIGVAGGVRRSLGLVIEPSIEPRWSLVLVASAVALACLAGVVPAMAAYRTDVLRSLRAT
jgi:putative ABC transport system permease protein